MRVPAVQSLSCRVTLGPGQMLDADNFQLMRTPFLNRLLTARGVAHRQGMTTKKPPHPAVELRCGGLRLTIQRVPGWLVAALSTATGSGLTAWLTSR